MAQIIELLRGGLTVTTPIDPKADKRIGFRTVIELGGDISVKIAPEVLALPPSELEQAYRRHHDAVKATLRNTRWRVLFVQKVLPALSSAAGSLTVVRLEWIEDRDWNTLVAGLTVPAVFVVVRSLAGLVRSLRLTVSSRQDADR